MDSDLLEFWVRDENSLAVVGTQAALRYMGIARMKMGEFNASKHGNKVVLVICTATPAERMAALKANDTRIEMWN